MTATTFTGPRLAPVEHPTCCRREHCWAEDVINTPDDELVGHENPGEYLTLRSVVHVAEGRTDYTVTVDGWAEVDDATDLDRLIAEAQAARDWLARMTTAPVPEGVGADEHAHA